ncbi:hypothetical protein DL89DRAFT_300954 [Linderina pennispora]|uniref:MFS general substrate transporter n=1 Tax=Linderina pennispora TaxID=61395 RepID=A0A1Y1WM61_9FUNG|nr:uncharacterized protein DL89DRAFT_300954 [Linderina pennispora]ORX74660.1 hypothetical protein DL89DRAFT_300954 [Linderina pennispora]
MHFSASCFLMDLPSPMASTWRITRSTSSPTPQRPFYHGLVLFRQQCRGFWVLVSANYAPVMTFTTCAWLVLIPLEFLSWGANLSSTMIAASVLGRIAIGALGDRVGPLNMMIFTTAASCNSVFALWLPSTSTSIAIAFSVIFGFFSGIVAGLPPVLTSRIFGVERMPSIIGLVMFAGGCGFLAATPSSGTLLSRFGNGADFDSMIVFTGLVLAVSIICQLSLRVAVSRRLFEKM